MNDVLCKIYEDRILLFIATVLLLKGFFPINLLIMLFYHWKTKSEY
jgi:hypothetical protein